LCPKLTKKLNPLFSRRNGKTFAIEVFNFGNILSSLKVLPENSYKEFKAITGVC
jgi:hypothetical protein